MARRIGIIGGGVAGIYAALAARREGAEVTLYEALPHLGGRAAGGEGFDTGRHLVSTAYHDFLTLSLRIGSARNLVFSRLALGAITGFRKVYWPLSRPLLGSGSAPVGLLTSPFLPLLSRLPSAGALVESLRQAADEPDEDELLGDGTVRFHRVPGPTVADHWDEFHWPEPLRRRLGVPTVLSICNGEPGEIAAQPYLSALARLLADRQRRAGWVRGDYGLAVTGPAGETLPREGVRVHLRTPARELRRTGDRWTITGRDVKGSFDAVLIALPPWALDGIAGDLPGELVEAARAVSAHGILTLRGRFADVDALPGPLGEEEEKPAVWFAEPHPRGGVLVERVLSALPSGEKPDFPALKGEFLALAKRFFDGERLIGEVEVRWYPRATPTLGPETPRPVIRQGDGLYYAGDWSATGLPPTLESAARAGRLAGRAAAKDC